MKPETATALRKLDRRQRIELVTFMLELMDADEFVAAMAHETKKDELSDDGDAVFQELLNEYGDHLVDTNVIERDIDLAHEAICEGRRQDAIDILADALGFEFRPAYAQDRLFPHRAPSLLLDF